MKILTVVGARPQMIKAAAVSRVLAKYARVQELLIHTGQHYDRQMSDVFFDELGLPEPFANLNVREKTHGAMTARMIERLEPVIKTECPDIVLLYGDTNSTLAGALVAVKEGVPIAHVESGVRTGSWEAPEESNRVVADRLCKWAFCSTALNYQTLIQEGLGQVAHLVGDVMYDAALLGKELASKRLTIVDSLGLRERPYILATCHRAETVDVPYALTEVLQAWAELATVVPVVVPLHPRTRRRVAEFGLQPLLAKITVLEPLGFVDMTALEFNASAIVTDSGGLQREAYFHGVPCIVAFGLAHWPEVVDAGQNVVAGIDRARIVACARDALSAGRYRPTAEPFGDGHAAERIVDKLCGASAD